MANREHPKTQAKQKWEFGGPIGVAAIMLVSHLLIYYLWISITYGRGGVVRPESLADVGPFLQRMWGHIAEGARPTWRAAAIYFGFIGVQALLACTMPGPEVRGLPVPTEGNVRHRYLCNGAVSWYVTLVAAALLHVTGLFRLTELADHLGPILTVATIFANLVALAVYAGTVARRRATRMSGSVVYDFFMGAVLNPRVGRLDLKFFVEIRVSWMLLFFLTLSAAAKHHQLHGSVGWPLVFMVVAHGLYTNACMKAEECIPTTWDIFHEKWGWMLIFWNLVGVPYVYCFNSYYLLANGPVVHSPLYIASLFVLLVGAYYVWDSAQAQRNSFRMKEHGTWVRRRTFPQLPWGTLREPRYLTTANGGTLLIDGWWAWARKIHYSADIVMALTWGLACGFSGALPYLYPAFFFVMILHRAARDEERCRAKYGADWDRYCQIVPGRFLPLAALWRRRARSPEERAVPLAAEVAAGGDE